MCSFTSGSHKEGLNQYRTDYISFYSLIVTTSESEKYQAFKIMSEGRLRLSCQRETINLPKHQPFSRHRPPFPNITLDSADCLRESTHRQQQLMKMVIESRISKA
jgi:hypothetical protein